MFCNEEKWHFINLNTGFSISLCAKAHNLRYVEGKHQGHGISKILHWLEKIMILLFIHWTQVPLLHKAVLILCAEGAGLVAMIMRDQMI